MLFQLGSFQFCMKEDNVRFQARGSDTMSIRGALHLQTDIQPVADVHNNSIDNLRAMMNEQNPQLLVSGIGHNHGYWVIEEVETDPLKEGFKVKLRWHGQRPY